jgi:hypothetical protein
MSSSLRISKLPPERGAQPGAPAAAGGCCCCCCCLHSIGGLIGAATAFAAPPVEDPVPRAVVGEPQPEPRHSAAREYWLAIVAVIVAVPIIFEFDGAWDDEAVLWAIALCFPAMQLVASALAAVFLLVSKRPGSEHRLTHLASITGRAFLGGMIGGVLMIIFAFLL